MNEVVIFHNWIKSNKCTINQVGTSQMNIYISYVNEKCPSCQYVQKCAFQIFLQYV